MDSRNGREALRAAHDRFRITCQDCDDGEIGFDRDRDREDYADWHHQQTGHRHWFRRDLPAPVPPASINGRWRLTTAGYAGRCMRCGERYPAGVEIERLEHGYAGPCCKQPAPQGRFPDTIEEPR